jgi:ADP-sugar diphosphatase
MENLEDAHKFKLWKNHIEKNGLDIHEIQEIFSRRRYNGDVLFSVLMLNATTPEGNKIPPICFLKGEVVTILVCLIDNKTNQKYLLLVKQRRIAEGGFTYEHPAGMVDDTKTPLEIAVQEVREETGVVVSPADLKPILHDKRLFPSTGTSDECMYFFYTELYLSKEEILSLNNQNTGTDYENESITTHVLPFEKAHSLINNTNCILLSLAYLKEVEDWDLLKKL